MSALLVAILAVAWGVRELGREACMVVVESSLLGTPDLCFENSFLRKDGGDIIVVVI